MNIRNANLNDLECICKIETACCPANQAASFNTLSNRLNIFQQLFWLIFACGLCSSYKPLKHALSMVGEKNTNHRQNGMITINDTMRDEMFKNAELHLEDGTWQSVFRLAVLPEYQNKGYAGNYYST